MSEQMPEQMPKWSWMARFGLVDTRNECFGKRNRGGDPSRSVTSSLDPCNTHNADKSGGSEQSSENL
jgi:hypothetical protein